MDGRKAEKCGSEPPARANQLVKLTGSDPEAELPDFQSGKVGG